MMTEILVLYDLNRKPDRNALTLIFVDRGIKTKKRFVRYPVGLMRKTTRSKF